MSVDVRQAAMEAPRGRFDPDHVEALRRNLAHQNEYVRDRAMRVLIRIKDPELAARALHELEVPSSSAKTDFMWALTQVAPDKAGPALRKVLENRTEERSVRRKALEYLERIKAVPPPAALLELTKDPDREFAAMVVGRISEIAPDILRPEFPRLLADPKLMDYVGLGSLVRRAQPEGLVPELMKTFRDSESLRVGAGNALVGWRRHRLPELRRMAKGADYDLRPAAVRVRNFKGPTRDLFLSLADDLDVDLQVAALAALENVGFGSEWEKIAKLTEDEDEGVRATAICIVLKHPRKELIPVLRRLVDDSQQSISTKAVVALLELEDPEIVPTMLGWLDSPGWKRLSVASEVLALRLPPGLHDRIPTLLNGREYSTRYWGIWLMEVAGLTREARRLLPLLGESYLGSSAAQTIANLEARDLIPDLAALLKSSDVQVRENALSALTGLKATEAAAAIRELLKDRDVELRIQAARSLGILGDRGAVPALIELLKDPRPRMREQAAKALGRIGDPAAAPALLPLAITSRGAVDDNVVEAIGFTRATGVVPQLVAMLDNWNEDHTSIVEALGEIGSKDAAPALIKHLEADRCRICVGRALRRMNAVEALPVMRKTLDKVKAKGGSEESLAFAAAQLGDPSYLVGLLDQTSEEDRLEAARYLCELGDRRGIPEILKQDVAMSKHFAVLNAVRKPELWKAVRNARFQGVAGGLRRGMIDRFAGRLGLKTRWEVPDTLDRRAWFLDEIEISSSHESDDGVEELTEYLVSGRWSVCREARRSIPSDAIVLEDDCIRIMPRADARKFWQKWLADEQAKKK
jgi:HEAT repeat protein